MSFKDLSGEQGNERKELQRVIWLEQLGVGDSGTQAKIWFRYKTFSIQGWTGIYLEWFKIYWVIKSVTKDHLRYHCRVLGRLFRTDVNCRTSEILSELSMDLSYSVIASGFYSWCFMLLWYDIVPGNEAKETDWELISSFKILQQHGWA